MEAEIIEYLNARLPRWREHFRDAEECLAVLRINPDSILPPAVPEANDNDSEQTE